MEPPQVEVITYIHTGDITKVEGDGETWWFTVDVFGAKFFTTMEPPFSPGDRVRITITKEPTHD
jgi:hypothetical protein